MKHYRHHWFYHGEPPEQKQPLPHWWHRGLPEQGEYLHRAGSTKMPAKAAAQVRRESAKAMSRRRHRAR